jgi:hypothetical protein
MLSYPSPRTGTAQDLMRAVTRAYERKLARDGTLLPVKTELGRRLVEPPARLLGMALGAVMEILPAEWTVSFHDWLFRTLAGRVYAFDPEEPRARRARELVERLRAETGREPALLAAISHPPVMGEAAHLNFALVRLATLALRAARGRPCRPRLVVAVDPFALDTTSIVEEGAYAGYMGSYHLGLDRLALGRGHPGPRLSPQTRWDRMPRRLFRVLREGGEVGMVLSGGVPDTGRVLYAAREWARLARRASPWRTAPERALPALLAHASFRRFVEAVEGTLHLPPGTWRRLDAWLMACAAGLVEGETAESAAAAALECLEVPAERRAGLLAELREDLTRETPVRRRLFRLLAGRVARRRPLVVVPVVHRMDPPGVELGEARALVSPDPDAAEEFARDFTRGNFA